MLIIPAIDLIDGKCVRLTEGDYGSSKIYSEDPVEQAKIFKDLGATRIHIVDLDGAKIGSGKNRKIIKEIKKETDLTIQTGGGIRKEDDIKDLILSGIDYVILGTILVEKFNLVESLMDEYGKYFIAGIDVKDGTIRTKGWENDTKIDQYEFGKKLFNIGFKVAIYTDISRDGKLNGPNIEATRDFATKTGLHTILSGGISNENDIKQAATLKFYGLQGIIVGKAYYENKIDLKKIIKEIKDL